ncbi:MULTISPECIES: plasmid partitioning/stability family protein [Enterobacteriaceae]|uniref:plasmid partitioning/stability family protein n=1 Tax=Enterobacteriaceae TaxID=543 RepID=UPI0015D7BE7F|nr:MULTISPECIES: plasmid partitioning/stability family protein [Enterobacteriaceae]MCU6243855.1 plasmid partitioning/stability family protein [Enterobacter asburiae]
MSTPNRKISFYLKPTHSRADKLADEMLNALPVKARGNACRAAMLAGMALMRQDPRLPHLIAEVFDDSTTIDQVRHLISSIFPDDTAAVAAAIRQITSLTVYKAPPMQPPAIIPGEQDDNAAVARRNAQNIFPQ